MRSKCRASKRGHREESARAACPDCGQSGRASAEQVAIAAPPSFESSGGRAIPALSRNEGPTVKPKKHNVGQTFLLPESMSSAFWSGTCFERVRFGMNPDTQVSTLQFTERSTRNRAPALVHLRDCHIDSRLDLSLDDRSSVSGLTRVGEAGIPGPTLTIRGPGSGAQPKATLVENIAGFETVALGRVRLEAANIQASVIRLMSLCRGSVVDSPQANTWILIGSSDEDVSVVINHRGQRIFVDPGFKGEIVENEPALIEVTPINVLTGRPVSSSPENDLRLALSRRHPDGRDGRYLHPHNVSAWEALIDGGYVRTAARYDDDGDEMGTFCEVDEDALAITLALRRNP